MVARTRFSLIEMLVSIAIMMILMTLLSPIAQKARDSAKILPCSSNLKQVITGYHQLMNDYEGGRIVGYRDYRYGWPHNNEPKGWSTRIRKHIFKGELGLGSIEDGVTPEENMQKGGKAFICPGDEFYLSADSSTPGKHHPVWWWVNQQDVSGYSSYGLNFTGAGEVWSSNDLPAMKSQIQHPDKMVIMADSGYKGIQQSTLITTKSPGQTVECNFPKYATLFGITRHGLHSSYDPDTDPSKTPLIPNMQVNIGYFDGQVASEKILDQFSADSTTEKIRWYGVSYGKYQWWQ